MTVLHHAACIQVFDINDRLGIQFAIIAMNIPASRQITVLRQYCLEITKQRVYRLVFADYVQRARRDSNPGHLARIRFVR